MQHLYKIAACSCLWAIFSYSQAVCRSPLVWRHAMLGLAQAISLEGWVASRVPQLTLPSELGKLTSGWVTHRFSFCREIQVCPTK